MNDKESYIKFSLDLEESNTASYCKVLQVLHKVVKDVDPTVLIIRYQPNKEEGEIVERNKIGVGVKAKDALLNHSEAIPNYTWQI